MENELIYTFCYPCNEFKPKDHTCKEFASYTESKGPYLTADACPTRWGKEQDPYIGSGLRD